MEFTPVSIVSSNIEFKQINAEDFESNGYRAIKTNIIPTDEGYISEQIKTAINFEEKNTVVINAGVGQGKTHTVMQIARQYYDQGYVLVFAVPYKSLIDQYKTELLSLEIPGNAVLDYRDLKEDFEDVNDDAVSDDTTTKITPEAAADFNIHLLTINCILGNPGDDFLEQSKAKSNYLNLTISRCITSNKRVILIMDEIHDGIHNFQQKFIFNLWKWKPVLHKILSVSATYNESAKIVIKYLAELTDNKIHIIESARTKIEAKQSDLFLLLYNKQHYNVEDNDLVDVFKYLLSGGKKINVLSYSKTIAESIVDSKKQIGKLLVDKYGDKNVNLCTGDSNSIFDAAKCNVGTTFSTGINIRGNDSAFIVLLPSNFSVEKRMSGVFSRGINTLIQALARIRDKSEIYIIMPAPKFLINFSNQNNLNYTANVKRLSFFAAHITKDKYYSINRQRELIQNTYNQLRQPVEDIITEIESLKESRLEKPSLHYPSLDDYILSSGEQVLYSKYEIFGKDLSIYTMWAAFNDQFLNCRLKAMSVLNVLVFKEGQELELLRNFTFGSFFEFLPPSYASFSDLFHFKSDKICYQLFREAIFKSSVFYTTHGVNGSVNKTSILSYKKIAFEKKILTSIQLIKKPYREYNRKFYLPGNTENEPMFNLHQINEDAVFDDTDYLLSCFSHAQRTDIPDDATVEEKDLIEHYKILAAFLMTFKQKFILTDSDGVGYFESDISFTDDFTESNLQTIYDSILYIKVNDVIIKNRVYSFFQKLPATMPANKTEVLNMIYKTFRDKFFDVERGRVGVEAEDNRRYIIKKEHEIPQYTEVINLLFSPEDAWFENPVTIDGYTEVTFVNPDHPEKERIY